jgi:hypothetical protein
MNEGRTVFAQLMDELPQYQFDKCIRRYNGDHHVRSLPTYEQFLVMAFAQLTYRESLRDIETCLRALGAKLYHSGIRQPTARSTLADANEKRDWRIFADFAHVLIAEAALLYADEPFGVQLTNNFSEPALTITQLYRCRWRIELFFKWIKQHLRIKAFYGTSDNAVRVQVWIAITVYLLVAILKKRLRLPASLYTILQIFSLTLFEKTPILQALSQQPPPTIMPDIDNQPFLPGFFTGQ